MVLTILAVIGVVAVIGVCVGGVCVYRLLLEDVVAEEENALRVP